MRQPRSWATLAALRLRRLDTLMRLLGDPANHTQTVNLARRRLHMPLSTSRNGQVISIYEVANQVASVLVGEVAAIVTT